MKIIQAVFTFLEAVNGKKDMKSVSELIRVMIDEITAADDKGEDGSGESGICWSRLDHDLRSPMNGILGFTSLLLEDITDPEMKWKAGQIQVSAQKLMKLLERNVIYGYSLPCSEAELNITEQEEPAEAPAQLTRPSARKKPRSGGKKLPNILIVEDNMVNSNLLRHHIKKYCHVFFSQTGKAAIELTKREKIDAIFMDINLGPGMDGTQAMLEIRKQPGHETLPIVAVTGIAGREEKDKFLKSGFNEFITKPFERREILGIIDNLFKLQR